MRLRNTHTELYSPLEFRLEISNIKDSRSLVVEKYQEDRRHINISAQGNLEHLREDFFVALDHIQFAARNYPAQMHLLPPQAHRVGWETRFHLYSNVPHIEWLMFYQSSLCYDIVWDTVENVIPNLKNLYNQLKDIYDQNYGLSGKPLE